MLKQNCPVCTVAAILVLLAAVNSGLGGLTHTNYVDSILSSIHLARVFDVLTLVAALVFLGSHFMATCPACKKK